MRVLTVDPGQSGALCLLDTEKMWPTYMDMPMISFGKTKFVDGARVGDFIEEHQPDHAVIEQLGTHGAADPMSKAAIAKMHCAWGVVLGAISSQLVPWETVTPSQWKGPLGLKGKVKEASHALASQVIPAAAKLLVGPRGGKRVDHADALCMGIWYVRKHNILC